MGTLYKGLVSWVWSLILDGMNTLMFLQEYSLIIPMPTGGFVQEHSLIIKMMRTWHLLQWNIENF